MNLELLRRCAGVNWRCAPLLLLAALLALLLALWAGCCAWAGTGR